MGTAEAVKIWNQLLPHLKIGARYVRRRVSQLATTDADEFAKDAATDAAIAVVIYARRTACTDPARLRSCYFFRLKDQIRKAARLGYRERVLEEENNEY